MTPIFAHEEPYRIAQPRASLLLSAGGHGLAIFLVLLMSHTASRPAMNTEPSIPVLLAPIPLHFRDHSAERSKAESQLAQSLSEPALEAEGVQNPESRIEVGSLDRSYRPVTQPGAGDTGEIVVGTLGHGSAAAKGDGEPLGIVKLAGLDLTGSDTRQESPGTSRGEEAAPRLVSGPKPVYSEEGWRLSVTGNVVLEVRVTASGNVIVLRVISGLGHGLDEAAIKAASLSRASPAIRGGKPVDVIARIFVVFDIS